MKISGNEKITNTFLKSLKRGESAKYADTDIPGFQVIVGKIAIVFYIHKKVKQKIYHIAIGKYPDISLDEARREALKILGSIANYQIPDAASARKQPTLEEAMEYYLTTVKNKKCTSSGFSHFRHLGAKPIADITKADIVAVHRKMKDTPIAANNAVGYVSAAVSKIALKLGISVNNPALNIDMYPKRARKRFLAEKEAPQIITALQGMQSSKIYRTQADALLMMIYTGARKSNVLKLNLKDIDDNNVWIIPESGDEVGTRSKSGREIIIPLNDFAIEIIEKRKKHAVNGYLFSYRGKPLGDVRKTFLTACRRARVEDCHIHDLRRTLGSWMLMQGASIETVSKTLGHSSIRITEQVYAHLLPGKISEATAKAIRAMKKGKA